VAELLDHVRSLVSLFNVFVLAYFAALSLNYTVLLVLGWLEISSFVRRRPLRDYDTIADSELSLPVSILIPAYNEERVIVESVRALLGTSYPRFEVVVVNDGSTDATLERLSDAFKLVPVRRVPRARLETQAVRGVYASATDERVVVIDKDNGGKGDALNAGLRYARYPLFCAVDSDTMLEADALQRLVWHFQAEPDTVACGGIVRIVNGSTLSGSRITTVQTPRSLIVNLQIVEYLRAFLMGRTAWSRLGALLIISGAFGLFRREVVIAAGGYATDTVGEDAELVVRLHRHCREQGRRYTITFIADPVCWTEAPTSRRILRRQRDRWQRGLIEAIVRHRAMLGRRRYGRAGMFAMPYFVVFEMIGPALELVGYATMTLSVALGWTSPEVALAFFALACSYGLVFSFGALRIEERAFQRYRRWRCLGRLVVAALVENFGYRQWLTWVRARAFWTLRRKVYHWGDMTRVGYAVETPPAPQVVDAPTSSAVERINAA
jgi:cellulose synthase/poly-beta-1,6-N-acetylglucosamine synthase-like glycosyltransferase